MSTRAFAGWAVMVLMAGAAKAAPGDLLDVVHGGDDPPLTILDPAHAQPCPLKSAICIASGARSTVSVASAPLATAGSSTSSLGKGAPVVPRFARAAAVAASSDGASAPSEDAPWTLELTGALKRPAWAGNALFLFFDLDDPESLENRQFTALFQAPLKAGAKLSARVDLAPEAGFRPGHTYRIRIVQLINGKEIILAESDVSLL